MRGARQHRAVFLARLACACAGLVAAPAPAQDTIPPPAPRFEITPFVGYVSKETFTDDTTGTELKLESTGNAGLILDFSLGPDAQIEVLYSRSDSALVPEGGGAALTDIKVEHLHLGGVYVYSTGAVQPFVAATAGATRLSPNAPGMGSDTNFSLGLGGGVKLFPTRHLGVRLEARAYGIQVDSDSAVFCNNGSCRILYDGSFIWQFAAHAGVVFAF
jgi:hypothetical protein